MELMQGATRLHPPIDVTNTTWNLDVIIRTCNLRCFCIKSRQNSTILIQFQELGNYLLASNQESGQWQGSMGGGPPDTKVARVTKRVKTATQISTPSPAFLVPCLTSLTLRRRRLPLRVTTNLDLLLGCEPRRVSTSLRWIAEPTQCNLVAQRQLTRVS